MRVRPGRGLHLRLAENRLPFVQNGRVDVVIATLTINDARRKVIGFAGPYYVAGQDLMVKADNKSKVYGSTIQLCGRPERTRQPDGQGAGD